MATRRSTDKQSATEGTPLGGAQGAPDVGSSQSGARRSARRKSAAARADSQTPATPAGAAARRSAEAPPARIEVSPEARRAMIAEAAYLRAERRGFSPGYELEDWLSAEREIDTLLAAEHLTAQL